MHANKETAMHLKSTNIHRKAPREAARVVPAEYVRRTQTGRDARTPSRPMAIAATFEF